MNENKHLLYHLKCYINNNDRAIRITVIIKSKTNYNRYLSAPMINGSNHRVHYTLHFKKIIYIGYKRRIELRLSRME